MPVRTGRQPFKRAQRVSDLLRQILSELFLSRVHHLGLEGLTITGVTITDDMQHARVYYRIFDPTKRAEVAKIIPQVIPFLRREAGKQLKIKYTPELQFEYDESLDYGHRIERLLQTIREQKPGDKEDE